LEAARMVELRPRNVTQGDLAALLRDNGYKACTKAAVSLAERSEDTGVQFTQKARNIIRGQFKPATRHENRVNGNKTTVWLDDELREWVESRAYMEEIPVGEFIRVVLREYKFLYELKKSCERTYRRLVLPFIERQKEAASDAATSEAAETVPNDGRADVVIGPYGHLHDTTKQEENQG
jgi:hypothetical protein